MIPKLTPDEMVALLRFCETCDDGQGYDVPKPMMKRLARVGVVNHSSGGFYEITEFGDAVIDAGVVGSGASVRPEAAIKLQAAELIERAVSLGIVVTIERRALKPLAMGHAEYRIETRPARAKS